MKSIKNCLSVKMVFKVFIILETFLVAPSIGQTVTYFETGEEFCGPFPSWKNIKTDYGAKGDGSTNDAAVISTALAAMKTMDVNTWSVLYFPAGTYCINSTVYNSANTRALGDDFSGMTIIGEDPATTVIEWNGSTGGTMMINDSWYGKISRLTFDGKNSAATGLSKDGSFSTGQEISDLVFKNITGTGLDLSAPNGGNGQAEISILRCTFRNVGCGILACNWNSLDEWVWYSLFEDCGYAINMCIGQFQIYNNVFLRSKTIDVNGGPYSCALANNISIGSKCFYNGDGYLSGNKIYNTTDTLAIRTEGYSSLVLIDNTIRSRTTVSPAVSVHTNHLFVGNTFTVGPWPVQGPNFRGFHGEVYPNSKIGNLIDNNALTYFYDWLAGTTPSSCTGCGALSILWACAPGTKKVVTKYTITQGTSSDGILGNFQLQGSNDWGSSWTTLDAQSNVSWTTGQKREFTISNSVAYGFYRIYSPVGAVSGVNLREIELFDAQNNDITEDPNGLIKGQNEDWGQYYAVDQKIVDPSTIPVPSTLSLPGTPQNMHRTIIEVVPGTGDDAAEIQKKILYACTTSTIGSNPVVHLPKGVYALKRTVVAAGNKDIQIVGDGTERGSIITWSGATTGPGFKFMGPSRVTMRDIFLNFRGAPAADVLLVEKCDKVPGGRVFIDGGSGGGYTAGMEADMAIFVDGVDNADITIRNGGMGCFTRGGVVVKGGRALGAGVNTGYQIDYLNGGMGNSPDNLFDVVNGGRLIAMGFRDETPMEGTYVNLTSASSGYLSIAAMSLAMTPSLTKPIVNLNGFNGTLTFLANGVGKGYDDNSGSIFFQIAGNGSNTKVLNAANSFSSQNSNTVANVWKDASSPAAKASMLNCNDFPNVTNQALNTSPDSQFVLDAVAQLRGFKTDAPIKKPDGTTDVKLLRVRFFAGTGRTGFILRGDSTAQSIAVHYAPMSMPIRSFKELRKLGPGIKSLVIPAEVKSIVVYNALGKVVWSSRITRATSLHDIGKNILAMSRNSVLFVRLDL